MTVEGYTRPAAVAGTFYPADGVQLRTEVGRLLNAVQQWRPTGRVIALVSPHAGYEYSGAVAAHAFSTLHGRSIDTVVIVSPSHKEYFDGISVFDGGAYSTPLGRVPIDEQLREDLLCNDLILESSARGHGVEHAIEVQLPFLQCMLGQVKFLPVVIGNQCREYCFHLGTRLATLLQDKNAIMIASTDLSHHHTSVAAERMDSMTRSAIESMDYEQIMSHLETGDIEACGGGPTVAVMIAATALGANKAHILAHGDSGDVTGDRRSVVGYVAAALLHTN